MADSSTPDTPNTTSDINVTHAPPRAPDGATSPGRPLAEREQRALHAAVIAMSRGERSIACPTKGAHTPHAIPIFDSRTKKFIFLPCGGCA